MEASGDSPIVTVRDPNWMPRPASMRTEIPGDPNCFWETGNYTYDYSGNISSIDGDQFYYDKVSRLVRAEVEHDGAVTTQDFSYDRFGNRTLHAPGGGTVPDLPFDLLTNRFTNPTSTSAYQYDGAGNLLAWPGGTATFDASGMANATTSSEKNQFYLYTPSDERLGVIDLMQTPAAVRWTLRGLSNKVLRTFDSEQITFGSGAANVQGIENWSWQKDYVYRSGSLLAAVVPKTGGGEETQHFHLDHLGTPRLKTNGFGIELTRHKYLPFGEELTTPSLDNEVMQYTSHERDRTPTDWDNDLDYMHARYYSPKVGRFLSLDSVLGRPERPQSWNRYGYVIGNPLRFVDPNGEDLKLVFDFKQAGLSDREQVSVVTGVRARFVRAGVENVQIFDAEGSVKPRATSKSDRTVRLKFTTDGASQRGVVYGNTNVRTGASVVSSEHAPDGEKEKVNFLVNVGAHEAGHGSGALTDYDFDGADLGSPLYSRAAESGSVMETNIAPEELGSSVREFSEEDARALRETLNDEGDPK